MTKQQILEEIEKLPDDATYEDAIERLQFLYMIEQGLKQADAGRVVPHEEAKRRIEKWLK